MFTYTQDQVNSIKGLYEGSVVGPTGQRIYDAYMQAAAYADGHAGPDQNSVIWLRGAAQVNSGVGPFSAFIRSYTDAQIAQRGITPSESDQKISDDIAKAVLEAIITNKTLPDIKSIESKDAGPAATFLFNGAIGGWAGCPLFVALGDSDPFNRYIVGDVANPYNAVAMLAAVQGGPGFIGTFNAGLASIFTNGIGDTIYTGVYIITQTYNYLSTAYGADLTTQFGNFSSAIDFTALVGTQTLPETYVGESGSEFVCMGSGDDTVQAGAGTDLIDGGGGNNEIDYSGFDNITITFSDLKSVVPFTAMVDKGNGHADALYNFNKIVDMTGNAKFIFDNSTSLHGLTIEGFPSSLSEADFRQKTAGTTFEISSNPSDPNGLTYDVLDSSTGDTSHLANIPLMIVNTQSIVKIDDLHETINLSATSTSGNGVGVGQGAEIDFSKCNQNLVYKNGSLSGTEIHFTGFGSIKGTRNSDVFDITPGNSSAGLVERFDGGGGDDTFDVTYGVGSGANTVSGASNLLLQNSVGSTYPQESTHFCLQRQGIIIG